MGSSVHRNQCKLLDMAVSLTKEKLSNIFTGIIINSFFTLMQVLREDTYRLTETPQTSLPICGQKDKSGEENGTLKMFCQTKQNFLLHENFKLVHDFLHMSWRI